MERIGFVGLGIMGKPMAGHLVAGGVSVMVNDINLSAVGELVARGAVSGTLADIAKNCGIIFLSLPAGSISNAVLFDAGGIMENAAEGTLVVETSSISPTEARAMGEKLKQKNIGFVDAPVSGDEPGAVAGTLAFMAGGSQRDFERALPCFKMMGSSAELIGEIGCGSVTKLANQIIVNMTIAAVSEALVLAAKGGANPEKVYKAIRGGLAGSNVLDAKAPMMYTRNFKPGGKISINHKDITNVMNTAHAIDVPLPLTAQLYEIFQSMKVSGNMDDDHSALIKYFERLAGIEVKAD